MNGFAGVVVGTETAMENGKGATRHRRTHTHTRLTSWWQLDLAVGVHRLRCCSLCCLPACCCCCCSLLTDRSSPRSDRHSR